MAEQTILKTAPAMLWRLSWRLAGQEELQHDYFEQAEQAVAAAKQREIDEYAELLLSPVPAELRWLSAAVA